MENVIEDVQTLAMLKLAERIAGKSVLETPDPDSTFALGKDDEVEIFKANAVGGGSVDVTMRTLLGMTISTEERDRVGDILRQDGADFDEYKKNPIVLFGHRSRELPIARTTKLTQGKKNGEPATFADAFFAEHDFAMEVLRLYEGGFLSASSVGFRPKSFKVMYDEEQRFLGIEFITWELLEWSAVPVPANPGATLSLRALADKSDLFESPDAFIKSVIARSVPKTAPTEETETPDGGEQREAESRALQETADRVRLSDVRLTLRGLQSTAKRKRR